MLPLAGLREIELRPPPYDLDAVINVRLQVVLQRKDLRLPVDEGEVDDPERGVHLRVMVQLVQYDVFDRVPFQFEDNPHPLPVRLVAEVRDPLDSLLLHQEGDGLA